MIGLLLQNSDRAIMASTQCHSHDRTCRDENGQKNEKHDIGVHYNSTIVLRGRFALCSMVDTTKCMWRMWHPKAGAA